MPSLPQGNQGYLEEHLSGQAEQAQLLPLIRAEKDSNSSIPQDPENKWVSQAVTGVKVR